MYTVPRWALSPISVISDIELSLISEALISDWESEVQHYIGYRNKVLSDILYPTCLKLRRCIIADWYSAHLLYSFKGARARIQLTLKFFCKCRISEWTLMSISEDFRYRNDSFQSDIFVSDIGITDVDVGCLMAPTLRPMSMPTYAENRSAVEERDRSSE